MQRGPHRPPSCLGIHLTQDMVRCAQCGISLPDESPHTAPTKIKPCPSCGALTRNYAITVSATSRLLPRVNLTAFSDTSRKRATSFLKLLQGFVRSARTTSGWALIERLLGDNYPDRPAKRRFDKRHDRYLERVETEDGRVLHNCDEPLSQHRGHGPAKQKQP